MHESSNVEIAHKLAEPEAEATARRSYSADVLEIAEAVVLALVAVATAWSGYCSAKWDGHQTLLYARSEQLRMEAAVAGNEGRQLLLFDALALNSWIDAKQQKHDQLAAIYERRFTPDFRTAFAAWLKTDPLGNARAPTGPFKMPEYHNPGLEHADRLTQEASAAFTEGTRARETSDRYVRVTVLLATILFLTAIAQRFKIRRVRVGLFCVATALMVYALVAVASYPRL